MDDPERINDHDDGRDKFGSVAGKLCDVGRHQLVVR